MKRFCRLGLFLAGALVSLNAPAFANDSATDAGENSANVDTSMDDVRSALGSMAVEINEIKSKFGLTIFGDVRARYAVWSQTQSDKNAPAPGTISDKAVGRYRARLGAKETIGDMTGGLRVATGSGKNPNSENDTYDNGFQNPGVYIDEAYLTYEPSFLDKAVKLTVGKMGNPLAFTPMTWDPDICPEGAALQIFKGGTQFTAAYFDLVNTAGTGQTSTNSGTGTDEYMANFQLEQSFKISDADLKLMLGYEYIPYANALAGGVVPAGYVGPETALGTSNTPLGSGNLVNGNGSLDDFHMGEVMVQLKSKLSGAPMQWTLHIADNFNASNVPVNAPTAGTSTPGNAGYTDLSTNLGWYLEAKLGDTQPGDWLGCLAASYVEPNAQLANLASDDANFTNTQYLFEQVGYGLQKNVSLRLSIWEIQRIYNAYYSGSTNKMITSDAGTSRDTLVQMYADCVFSF
ncbi:MAG: putative porin [bacterium]